MPCDTLWDQTRSEKIEDSEGLVALPVTDYKRFVGQFNGDASSEISDLIVAGMPMLVAEKSGYAVLVPSDSEHRSLLKAVLEREAGVSSEIAAWDGWIAENDATAVVLPRGVKLLAEKAIEAIEEVKEQFSGMEELGDQADQMAAVFDMYLQMLRLAKTEVHAVADGLRIDDAGNILLGGRVRFTPGGRLENTSDALNPSTEGLLLALPGGPFVGAVGASLSPECAEQFASWSVEMMKNNPALYGMKLSDEAADKYLEMTLVSMKGMRGLSMMLVPSEEGEAILDGALGTINTDDATDYLTKYEKTMDEFRNLIEESDSELPYEVEVTKAAIAGVNGLKVTTDMNAALAAQRGSPQATEMFEKMFGEHGKLTVHLLAVDKDKILFSYGSEKTIERQIAALKSGEPGLVSEVSIQETTALLPKEAGLVAYLSPRGAVAWFKNIASLVALPHALGEVPEFPETPAVGFSAKIVSGGLETELVVPTELPKAVKEYIESVRENLDR